MSDQSMIRGSELTNSERLNSRRILIGLSIVLVGLPTVLIGAWIALAPVLAASAATPKWVLKADYIDACCCDLACPCIFGGSPTHGYCKGASLVEIKEGHYGQVDLAGVTVLAVYNSGKWIKFFVSENATTEQTDAVVEFLPVAEGFFKAPVRDVRNVAISVKRTKDKVKIKTEGTLIELQQIRNAAGEPIKVLGLPAQGFPGLPYLNHTQYKTIALTHDSEKEEFKFSGTNGFTARIDASSESEASRSGGTKRGNN
ncbi:MAG: DUF1326 domain-containing protein [Planctomycetota bacterium]|jgi:hypothetical protein